MKYKVFNTSIGSTLPWQEPRLTPLQEQEVLASLFEQIMLFDGITIPTHTGNFPLVFLIKHLGLSTIEALIERDFLNFLQWTPIIVTTTGTQLPNGEIDHTTIYGQPPLVGGSMQDNLKTEEYVDSALDRFSISRQQKRSFKSKILNRYGITPAGLQAGSDAANFVIDAYKHNDLENLGLPYIKEPEQLDLNERSLLLDLSYKVLESAVLKQYELVSFEDDAHCHIFTQGMNNIAAALKLTESASHIFTLENLPDLKQLYLTDRLSIADALKLRHKSNAKYFRRWLRNASQTMNMQELSEAYIAEARGNKKAANSMQGKLTKTVLSFTAGNALGNVLSPDKGIIAGLGLSLLENLFLDRIIQGNNPAMFIDAVKHQILSKKNLI